MIEQDPSEKKPEKKIVEQHRISGSLGPLVSVADEKLYKEIAGLKGNDNYFKNRDLTRLYPISRNGSIEEVVRSLHLIPHLSAARPEYLRQWLMLDNQYRAHKNAITAVSLFGGALLTPVVLISVSLGLVPFLGVAAVAGLAVFSAFRWRKKVVTPLKQKMAALNSAEQKQIIATMVAPPEHIAARIAAQNTILQEAERLKKLSIDLANGKIEPAAALQQLPAARPIDMAAAKVAPVAVRPTTMPRALKGVQDVPRA